MSATISLAAFDAAVDATDCVVVCSQSGVNVALKKADAKQWARSSIANAKEDRLWRPYVVVCDETLIMIGASGSSPMSMEVVP